MFYSFKKVSLVSSVLVGFLFSTSACSSRVNTIADGDYALTAQEINSLVDRVADTPRVKYVSEADKDTKVTRNLPFMGDSNLLKNCLVYNSPETAFYMFNTKPVEKKTVATVSSINTKNVKAFSIYQGVLKYGSNASAKESFDKYKSIFVKCYAELNRANVKSETFRTVSNYRDFGNQNYLEWKTHASQISSTFQGVKLFNNYILLNNIAPYNYSDYLGYLEWNHQIMNSRIG